MNGFFERWRGLDGRSGGSSVPSATPVPGSSGKLFRTPETAHSRKQRNMTFQTRHLWGASRSPSWEDLCAEKDRRVFYFFLRWSWELKMCKGRIIGPLQQIPAIHTLATAASSVHVYPNGIPTSCIMGPRELYSERSAIPC